jgi:hypothetical protein
MFPVWETCYIQETRRLNREKLHMRSIDKSEIRERLIQFDINFAPLKFKQIQIEPQLDRVDAVADAIIEARFGNLPLKFMVEVQGSLTPKLLLASAARIARSAKIYKTNPLLLVPFLSEENCRILQELQVSCIDLCGNGILIIPGKIFIERTGSANLFKEERSIKNVYRNESSIVGRTFLLVPIFDSLKQLEETIQLLNGHLRKSTISKVVSSLERDLIVTKDGRLVRLIQPDKLLDALKDNYRPPKTVKKIKGKLKESWSSFRKKIDFEVYAHGSQLCQTGRSSVNLYATMAEDKLTSFYTDIDPEWLLELGKADYIETERFPDFEITQVEESFPFFDQRTIEGFQMASPIQCYLELAKGDKRQQEVSEQVKELILREVK